jgi:hypothetical protein
MHSGTRWRVALAALLLSFPLAACQPTNPDAREEAGEGAATAVNDLGEAAATAVTAGETAIDSAAEAVGTTAAAGATAVEDAMASPTPEEVEVELGVTHTFTADLEVKREGVDGALDQIEADNPGIDLTALREAVATLEKALDAMEAEGEATADLAPLDEARTRLDTAIEEAKAANPMVDWTPLDTAVAELDTEIEELRAQQP